MATNSKIEWTHHTANLWWGCTEVHAGCDNCYARVLDNRWIPRDEETGKMLMEAHWGDTAPRRAIASVWKDLGKMQRKAAEPGERHRVFVGSMMDIAEKSLPCVDIKGNKIFFNSQQITTGFLRDRLFDEISKGMYPNLIFLFLSKRPLNYNRFIPEAWKITPPDNVMFGTSVVNQQTADKLIPQLLEVNGKRFLSIEPQLDNLAIRGEWASGLHWIINGGESGAIKRPFYALWGRLLKLQCRNLSIPFFFKQMDKVQEIPEDLLIREFPKYHSDKI